jgi:UDPglucose 6-dehydrogenase
MRVAVIGTGYVGLVTGTCFSEMGNDVVCVDIDKNKVTKMRKGQVPIYEPGLKELFKRNIDEGRLRFTEKLAEGIKDAEVIFLALPTPPKEDGSADLSYILKVADDLGEQLDHYAVIIDKSTVPVGTAKKVKKALTAKGNKDSDVVSNPEFLREGQAVADFLNPDRVVIGASSKKAIAVMKKLYLPFVHEDPDKLIITNEESAEMIKYAANAMLATRISFINELSRLCEAVGADIGMVRRGVGSDNRIGPAFLYPGPGYGGSCFPKDTLALQQTGTDYGVELGIVRATIDANQAQQKVLPNKVLAHYKQNVEGKKFALWGLAFKNDTDDIRESPALKLIDIITEHGGQIVAYDPQATQNVRKAYKDNKLLSFVDNEYKALAGADALIVATEWKEFSTPNFPKIKKMLKSPVIFDGRNLYELSEMKNEGFHYESIGREVVK